jgi:hypothetical protein
MDHRIKPVVTSEGVRSFLVMPGLVPGIHVFGLMPACDRL